MVAAVTAQPSADEAKGPLLSLSPGFSDWLAAQDVSLAFTTYQAGRLFFVGRKPDGGVAAHERRIPNCRGLWSDGQTIWTNGTHDLWRFENALRPGETTATGADRLYAPRESRVTGNLDTHDIALGTVEGARRPIFVNTLCNCLATVDDVASFRPLWKPPFVSGLAAEDRCHLNGLAVADDGRPAFVTAVAATDTVRGWREHRCDGGVVVDVATGAVVASGLSMPHSPRLRDGRLWLLNSGMGELVRVDPRDGAVTTVAFCPGFARGLAFAGRYAVVGLSRPRRRDDRGETAFEGLPLDGRLAAAGLEARCGLMVVDGDTGATVASLTFEHTIGELYDVAVLPGVRRAEAIGFADTDIARIIRV